MEKYKEQDIKNTRISGAGWWVFCLFTWLDGLVDGGYRSYRKENQTAEYRPSLSLFINKCFE